MKYTGEYNGCPIWTDESVPDNEIWGLNFKDWSIKKMKIDTNPTFTTPGAAHDWLKEKPRSRTIKPDGLLPFRIAPNGPFQFEALTGWTECSAQEWRAFFENTSFTGHETPDAEDELMEAIEYLVREIMEAQRSVNPTCLSKNPFLKFARAIIAARK